MFAGSRTALLGAVGLGLLGLDGGPAVRAAALGIAAAPAVAAQEPPQAASPKEAAPKGGRVSGRLLLPAGFSLSAATITIAGSAGGPDSSLRPEDMTILPDGSFQFRSVPAGAWEIRARARVTPGGITHYATFRLLMEARDVEALVMPLYPAASLTGTVSVEPSGTPLPPGARLHAPPADGSAFGDAAGDLLPGGGFTLTDLIAGPHLLQIDGLPEPWVVERVMARGQDVTDAGLELAAGQRIENVLVTVTRASTELSGRVRGAAGQPVADALVLVIPLAEQFWGPLSRRLARRHTDAEGRFSVRGLPAGEYRAVATTEFEDAETSAPALLRRLSETGTAVSIDATTPHAIDLPLTIVSRQGRDSGR